MRLFEITSSKALYHGSPQPLKIGKTYRVRQWSTQDQGGVNKEVELFLETFRPNKSIPRNRAFYLVSEVSKYLALEKIESMGGLTDYVYEVNPVGRIEQHDLQWINDLDSVMSKDQEGRFNNEERRSYSFQMPPIIKSEVEETKEMLAKNYWNGKMYPYKPWSLTEYLTPSFNVVKLVYKD